MNGLSDEDLKADRQAHLEQILESDAEKKLIVAGPGTGKTHTFGAVLDQVGEPRLVLTFLNRLVDDLSDKLADRAYVYSFHGFARWVLHTRRVEGVTTQVRYFPALTQLVVEDLRLTDGTELSQLQYGQLFRNLVDDPLLDLALRSGTYYDAVGHDDSVYRVLKGFQAEDRKIPQYQQVLVDEFQDFSALEVAFIEELGTKSPVLIVGDDDQAIYAFRDARPEPIRELAGGDEYENFELPYCSRCTEVLVAATHTVVNEARAIDLLDGRLDKRFVCYLPDKRPDSEAFPRIVHAVCSTQSTVSPYMGRYIAGRIREIDPADIAVSREDGRPTVLVIGPKPFLPQVETVLRNEFQNVVSAEKSELELDPLYAVQLLQREEASRLGWRILLQIRQPPGWEDMVARALTEHAELFDLLTEDFRNEHLRASEVLRKLNNGETVDHEERKLLANVLGVPEDALEEFLADEEDDHPEVDPLEPVIMLTSLMGAKGLQADHVFVVGVNAGHFPRHNGQPTNEEVCQLLVALTRTRRSCTLVSTTRLAGVRKATSRFVAWLEPHIEGIYVDKTYLETRGY